MLVGYVFVRNECLVMYGAVFRTSVESGQVFQGIVWRVYRVVGSLLQFGH